MTSVKLHLPNCALMDACSIFSTKLFEKQGEKPLYIRVRALKVDSFRFFSLRTHEFNMHLNFRIKKFETSEGLR